MYPQNLLILSKQLVRYLFVARYCLGNYNTCHASDVRVPAHGSRSCPYRGSDHTTGHSPGFNPTSDHAEHTHRWAVHSDGPIIHRCASVITNPTSTGIYGHGIQRSRPLSW